MPRHDSSLRAASRHLVSHSTRHCSRRRSLCAAVATLEFYSFCLLRAKKAFLQQVVSEARFGSLAPVTIDDTKSEVTLICLRNMSVPKIETDKLDGKSDFVMWRRKMKAILRWFISFRC
ncbi:hypothetical protein M9H77_27642 [Catharanthus roseus]|uniref:Uncharacterized protein n=1 Tax=Catharanthus roseus TaxID=4058 RepID=A0ACC0ADY4_CATRO|nr:hypothetical protein M9H77_27642 [Catharanthus roseus]